MRYQSDYETILFHIIKNFNFKFLPKKYFIYMNKNPAIELMSTSTFSKEIIHLHFG